MSRETQSIRSRSASAQVAVLLMLLLALAACAGSMDSDDEPVDVAVTAAVEVETAVAQLQTIEASGEDVTVVEEPLSEDDEPPVELTAVAPVLTLPPPTEAAAGEQPDDATPAPVPTPTPNFGSVAYDVPTRMTRGEIVQVILLVNPTVDEDGALVGELQRELDEVGQAPSNVITSTVRVARRMSAALNAVPPGAFEIVPLQTSNIQFLDNREPTKWEWSVRPLTGGTHQLSLTIERYEVVDGEQTLRGEESYRDDITVEVPLGLRVRDFAGSVGGVLLVLGLVAAVALSVVLRRRHAPPLLPGRDRDETLDREQIGRVTPILADALAQLTPEQRVAFLSQAGVDDLVDVDLNGSARAVALTLLTELNRYGETAAGRPAVLVLLDYLAAQPALPRSDKATLDAIRGRGV